MVCTIPASVWTWLVRSRKASAVTMNGAGFDVGEGKPGSIIILQKRLGVGTAAMASSVGRGWSGFGWCSAPESSNGRSDDMSPPSSAKMLERIWCMPSRCVPLPCLLSKHCWFRPVCASLPAIFSVRSRPYDRWGFGLTCSRSVARLLAPSYLRPTSFLRWVDHVDRSVIRK
ncbi:hypothetical protein B296_00045096 [Ensete ventricosum]|uniref:Uncharacterized protein n=1 Tax=Ensete ventricosum TaxID=4639 RepID=A0A426X9A9_ENSVE|nr:hypothetical protein B296_00045096 [Ensete ventricosum]